MKAYYKSIIIQMRTQYLTKKKLIINLKEAIKHQRSNIFHTIYAQKLYKNYEHIKASKKQSFSYNIDHIPDPPEALKTVPSLSAIHSEKHT